MSSLQENPFVSPAAEQELVTPIEEKREKRENLPVAASLERRRLNHIVDSLIVGAACYGIGYVIGFVFAASGTFPIAQGRPQFPAYFWVVVLSSSMLFFCFYFILMESVFGRTIGKLLTGTKVVGENGEHPHVMQVVGRTFARLIPFDPQSFKEDTGRRGWHDTLSSTVVVLSNPKSVEEETFFQ
ncbi:RDD family protein [Bremerella sp. T1]|uniref:RDD family protein n=1 Tax=Bremerella sp. TYQ1 TaxID=3119568 RepID=UPI001CCB44DF|nr:RDD family protein [Bremerella volcania]UBM38539.1 RDD family protein [Bremerella volcania]